jgi:hypothetical protein
MSKRPAKKRLFRPEAAPVEFLAALTTRRCLDPLRTGVRKADDENTGVVSPDQLRKILADIGFEGDPEQVSKFLICLGSPDGTMLKYEPLLSYLDERAESEEEEAVEGEGDSAESDAAAGQQETTAEEDTEGALAEDTGEVDEADLYFYDSSLPEDSDAMDGLISRAKSLQVAVGAKQRMATREVDEFGDTFFDAVDPDDLVSQVLADKDAQYQDQIADLSQRLEEYSAYYEEQGNELAQSQDEYGRYRNHAEDSIAYERAQQTALLEQNTVSFPATPSVLIKIRLSKSLCIRGDCDFKSLAIAGASAEAAGDTSGGLFRHGTGRGRAGRRRMRRRRRGAGWQQCNR